MEKKIMKKRHGPAKDHHTKRKSSSKGLKAWKTGAIALAVMLVVSLGFNIFSSSDTTGPSEDKIAEKTMRLINEYMLEGTTATLGTVEKEDGLYKLTFTIQGQEYEGFVSPDGQTFFPQAVNLTALEQAEIGSNEEAQAQQQQQVQEIPKAEVPEVELFVMSHCPYGTQIEKGILPVLDLFGDKIDFELKFVNYVMHGEKEIKEQMLQYCVQKDYPAQLMNYLTCFLEDGDTERCLDETELDREVLDSCIEDAEEEFGVMKDFADQSTWMGQFPRFSIHQEENQLYGVRGSPTLVINQETVSSERSPAAIQEVICSAFEDAPEECDTALSTATPGPGFGLDSTGSATTAQC